MQPQSFAILLKKYRVAAGLTQEELAERAGISTRGISDLERGVRRTPYKGTVELLTDALGLVGAARETFKNAAGRSPGQAMPSPAPAITNSVPLLGRSGELKLIAQYLAGDEPPVLMLTGEPGIGKTRLLNEIATRGGEQGWTVLEGSCTRRGGQTPYAPILEALSGRLSQQSREQQQIELKNCEWLVRLLPELSEVIAPPTLKWQLPLEQERRLVFEAVGRYLTNIAGISGTLLILDDLQWTGGDALDLLAALIHAPKPLPLAIVSAYRNTDIHLGDPLSVVISDLARKGLVRQVELSPLNEQAATDLVNLLLEDPFNQGQTELIKQILQRTGGVPFFLISCVRALQLGFLDNNGLAESNQLPWDVKQTIQQRIVGLPRIAQELLGIAAVIGLIVSAEHLLAVATANWTEQEVLAALELVCRVKLLIESENPAELSYRFAHGLIREVVETDLSVLRYKMLHGKVADVLESKIVTSQPALLAYHYRQAGDWKKALPYLLQAIEHSRRTAAQREEADLLAQAIECAERTGQSQLALELRLQRGKACRLLAMWAEADKELSAALGGIQSSPIEQQAELFVTLAEVRHWQLDTVATRRYASEAVQLSEQSGRSDLLAKALSVLALAESSEGDIVSSVAHFQTALSVAGSGQLSKLVSGLEFHGLIHYWLGRSSEAITINQQALELARQTYDTTSIARALANLGLSLSSNGRYAEAFKSFAEARQFAEEQGMGQWMARAISMCGGTYLDIFNYERAEALALEARQISQKLNWPLADTSSGIDLLLNFTRTNQLDKALLLVGEVGKALEAGQGAHGWLWRLRFTTAEGELALAQQELDVALHKAQNIIAHSRISKRVKYEVLGLEIQGKALAALNQVDKAEADLQKTIKLAHSSGNPALHLRSILAYLSLFKSDNLLAYARSLMKIITVNLDEQETIRNFLSSPELKTISSELFGD